MHFESSLEFEHTAFKSCSLFLQSNESVERFFLLAVFSLKLVVIVNGAVIDITVTLADVKMHFVKEVCCDCSILLVGFSIIGTLEL